MPKIASTIAGILVFLVNALLLSRLKLTSRSIYIFNLEKNEWRVGPEIAADRRRGAAGVVVYNDKIYMVCGIQDGHWDGHVSWMDEYEPKTNR